MEETVLIYIEKNHSYLMLYRNKKENNLNEGKYIGVGGHIEPGETKEEAIIREVKEETGLTLLNQRYVGKVHFIDTKAEEMMYLFTSDSFSGELINCDEGELMWVNIDDLNGLNMWEGDYYFLDKILENKDIPFELLLRYDHGSLVEYIDYHK